MSANFKRNIAIIIGIDNYQNGISTLKTAVNDAQKISHILQTQHGYKVWGLLDKKASLEACWRLLEEFLPTKIQESDRVLFYFAGHGIALNGDHGPEGFLIPQDAQLGDTDSYLPMARLQAALSNLPCRHFLAILDCCFAGAFRWSSTRDLLAAPEVIHREHYERFIESPAWQVITSAAHNQEALDNLSLQGDRGQIEGNHSPFANALIEALEGKADYSPPAKDGRPPGDGVTTATELYLYLRDRVEIAAEKKGQKQTPGLYPLQKHDRGEYIFLTPGHELNLPDAPPLDESQNPYRGLESFQTEHSDLFFGRQKLTQRLYRFCQRNPLIVVLGASGTGKSSLVRAGLIPRLQQETAEESWQILSPMRPGEYPFKGLNKILKEQFTERSTSGSSILNSKGWDRTKILSSKLKRVLRKDRQAKLLLVVDQTEELITLSQNRAECHEFLALLAQWLEQYPDRLRIVLTLRSDFEPQLRNLVLKSYWQKARFIVPAMTREELREAIEKPAAKRVIYFEPYSLVDRLIDEVAQMPGALPLLSFALSELYLKYLQKFRVGVRDKRAITQEDYAAIGGVAMSLTRRANYEYDQLVEHDPAYAQTIRNVMLRMIAVDGGEIARRQVLEEELEYPEPENTRVKQVIRSFAAARLLVKGQDSESKPYVEPAHDALVKGWQKLLSWKQQEGDNLHLQRRLTLAAKEWKDLQSHEKQLLPQELVQYLWHNNPNLDVLKDKLDNSRYWFNQVEAEFVERSSKRKSNNGRRSTCLVVIFLILIGVLFYIFDLRKKESIASKDFHEKSIKVLQEFSLEDVLIFQRFNEIMIPGNITPSNVNGNNDWERILQERDKELFAAMSRDYKRGQVVAIGHESIFFGGRKINNTFLLVMLNFLNGINGQDTILITNGHCENLTQSEGWDNKKRLPESKIEDWDYNINEISGVINSDKLEAGNILIIGNAWGNFAETEIKAIEKFVAKGGQLLLVGTGWSWQKDSDRPEFKERFEELKKCDEEGQMEGQNKDDISTYPMNTILEQFGARFEGDRIEISPATESTSTSVSGY